jgi:di/tricarboxylate transporter
MSLDIALLLLILLFTIAAFVREWMPIEVVALTCLGLLLLFGLVTPKEAISGFSNPAVITVMMMFVLSHGLVESGLIGKLSHRIASLSGRSHWKASLLLLTLAGLMSGFINNVAAVSIFMPVAIHIAKHYRFSPSKILLPLSYACIFGGTCTLIGTSTNLIVSSLSEQHGLGAFALFEFVLLGGFLFLVGSIYNVVVPMRLLPSRSIISSLTRKYHMSAFLTEVKVPRGSKLAGHTVVEEQVSERFQLNVLEIIRGQRKISLDIRNTRLRADDVLIVRGGMEDILSFKEQYGLLLLTDIKLTDSDLSDENNILVEVQLSPSSSLVGLTLKQIDFRKRYGCFILALNRTGELIREKLASIPLQQWDTLLVFGPRTRVEALHESGDIIPLQEVELRLGMAPRWWVSVLTIAVVVVLAATGVMPILKASILGVVVLLVTRSLPIQQAYRAINWTVIFLLAAILPLGVAMENTGLAAIIGEQIGLLGAQLGPLAVLSLIYLTTSLLTEIISNNSTAVLMVPIAISTAASLGVDPKPLLMAIAFASSASFLTPIGYQTNAMVYGPGGYRLRDFLIAGAPLKVAFWLLSTWLIPVIWPL